MASSHDQLCDLLLDLQHDLGKYLRQPLAYLPAGAAPSDVRAAVHRALRETRRGPGGVRAAREIWAAFTGSCAADLRDLAGWTPLVQAVDRALAWEEAAGAAAQLDRAAVSADLGAVEPAIRALLDELRGVRGGEA